MLSAGSTGRWVRRKEWHVPSSQPPSMLETSMRTWVCRSSAHLARAANIREYIRGRGDIYKMALYSLLGAKRAELWRLASCDAAALRLRQPSRSQAAAQGRRPPRRSRSCASQRKAMPPRGSCWLGVRRGGLPADLQAGSAPRESMLPDRRCTRTEPALRR